MPGMCQIGREGKKCGIFDNLCGSTETWTEWHLGEISGKTVHKSFGSNLSKQDPKIRWKL